MTIDWSVDGKVIFTMYDYLEDILAEALEDFDGEDVTPAVSNLFQVDEACKKLDVPTADLFHCFLPGSCMWQKEQDLIYKCWLPSYVNESKLQT